MAYLPLHNFKYDSGPRRIQSGPDHEGYIVVTSGVNSLGADNGIVVDGTPLSGVTGANQRWGYDANWRYVPATARSQVYAVNPLNPTEYSMSGVLAARAGVRIGTKLTVANSQVSSAIGPAYGVINPRGAALQSNSTALHPERYMYFGGGAPDNQSYTPYNTPDSNTAAEGTTGGGVTRRNYENSLLLNSLGSQGTSDRSQWVYHQPVYCTTYAQSVRPTTPGLMSTVVRSTYRGSATSYNANFGYLFGKSGLSSEPGEEFSCPYPVGCPETDGLIDLLLPGDTLSAYPPCDYTTILWFNTGSSSPVGEGDSYQVQEVDIGHQIFFTVIYPDGSEDSSSPDCFPAITGEFGTKFFYILSRDGTGGPKPLRNNLYTPIYDYETNLYFLMWWNAGGSFPAPHKPVIAKVNKDKQLVWAYDYTSSSKVFTSIYSPTASCFVNGEIHSFSVLLTSAAAISVTYLERLVIDAETGDIKKADGLSYTGYSYTSFTGTLGVTEVITDGNGTYWVLATVPEWYAVSGAGSSSTGIILCIREAGDGSLTTLWTYELIQQYTIDSRYGGAEADGFRVDFTKNILYFQTNSQSNFSRPYLHILNASTGAVLYRSTFDGVNGQGVVLGFRACFLDEADNLYQVANNSEGSARINNGTALWVSKKDPARNVVWMKNYDNSLPRDLLVNTQCLLICDGVLVFACLGIYGDFFPDYAPYILLIDPATGSLQRVISIRYPLGASYSGGYFGPEITLLPGQVSEEFILVTSFYFCMSFNVHDIPLNVTLNATGPTGATYVFADLTAATPVDYVSYQKSIVSFATPNRPWGGASTYYTLPLAGTSRTIPSGVTYPYVSGVYMAPV